MLAIENDNEGLMTLTILFVDGDDEADDVDDGGTTWWCLFVASDDVTDDCDWPDVVSDTATDDNDIELCIIVCILMCD